MRLVPSSGLNFLADLTVQVSVPAKNPKPRVCSKCRPSGTTKPSTYRRPTQGELLDNLRGCVVAKAVKLQAVASGADPTVLDGLAPVVPPESAVLMDADVGAAREAATPAADSTGNDADVAGAAAAAAAPAPSLPVTDAAATVAALPHTAAAEAPLSMARTVGEARTSSVSDTAVAGRDGPPARASIAEVPALPSPISGRSEAGIHQGNTQVASSLAPTPVPGANVGRSEDRSATDERSETPVATARQDAGFSVGGAPSATATLLAQPQRSSAIIDESTPSEGSGGGDFSCRTVPGTTALGSAREDPVAGSGVESGAGRGQQGAASSQGFQPLPGRGAETWLSRFRRALNSCTDAVTAAADKREVESRRVLGPVVDQLARALSAAREAGSIEPAVSQQLQRDFNATREALRTASQDDGDALRRRPADDSDHSKACVAVGRGISESADSGPGGGGAEERERTSLPGELQ